MKIKLPIWVALLIVLLASAGFELIFVQSRPTRLEQFGKCKIEAFGALKEYVFKEQNFAAAAGDYIEACMQANGYVVDIKPGTHCNDNTELLKHTSHETSVAFAYNEDCYVTAPKTMH